MAKRISNWKKNIRSASSVTVAVVILGLTFIALPALVFANDARTSNFVKLSKQNMSSNLDVEFQKYMRAGAPDAMCEFGMEEHRPVTTSHNSPKITGLSKAIEPAENRKLTWSNFRPFAVMSAPTQR